MNEEIKNKILKELRELDEYYMAKAEEADARMREIKDTSSRRWYIHSAEFSTYIDATLKANETKWKIEEILASLTD